MQERPQNFAEADSDPELTLPAPRFDADEARRAHPVVPLDEAHPYAPAGRARFRGGTRRHLTLTLLAVVLLFAVAFGGVVALRRAHTKMPADDAQDGRPAQADAAPQQTAPAQPSAPAAQADANSAQENASAQPRAESVPTKANEEKAGEQKTSEEKPEDRAPSRPLEERASHTRRGAEPLPPPIASRAERREDGEVSERRARIRDHDWREGRDEDGDEGEASKASKHAKKGEARLVDVLVGRPRP